MLGSLSRSPYANLLLSSSLLPPPPHSTFLSTHLPNLRTSSVRPPAVHPRPHPATKQQNRAPGSHASCSCTATQINTHIEKPLDNSTQPPVDLPSNPPVTQICAPQNNEVEHLQNPDAHPEEGLLREAGAPRDTESLDDQMAVSKETTPAKGEEKGGAHVVMETEFLSKNGCETPVKLNHIGNLDDDLNASKPDTPSVSPAKSAFPSHPTPKAVSLRQTKATTNTMDRETQQRERAEISTQQVHQGRKESIGVRKQTPRCLFVVERTDRQQSVSGFRMSPDLNRCKPAQRAQTPKRRSRGPRVQQVIGYEGNPFHLHQSGLMPPPTGD
eukprot:Cvel_19430.t1-p1 / transcript=Cvel_19430.t1 / gene=Cvel_19430 / organism=Chromera_velia_CCMP2878 / gene_product=hypothetical protein / transcript_product=hypothetical protein / location=Cvel_scaffold1673:38987-39968(+) / protein_length=327 / sequence_SO=supercontig / SO=protein_coding / is_pseudo=false